MVRITIGVDATCKLQLASTPINNKIGPLVFDAKVPLALSFSIH